MPAFPDFSREFFPISRVSIGTGRPHARLAHMSLRSRVVAMIGLVLLTSVALGAALAGEHARRALSAELASGMASAERSVRNVVDVRSGDRRAEPDLKARLADQGGTVAPSSAPDFSKLIAAETEKWGKVVRFAGIKVE